LSEKKRTYQLSTAERARRGAQKRLRAAKKKATQATKKQKHKEPMPESWKKQLEESKREYQKREQMSSTWEISPFYPHPFPTLWVILKLFSKLIPDLKKSFFQRVSGMSYMGERLAVASHLLYLLIPYAIAIIPIIEVFS
jgi:hypothetical protein